MDITAEIAAAETNPRQLEQLYQSARQKGQDGIFRSALQACYDAAPDNVLYAAWFYRFQQSLDESADSRRSVNWLAAVPLSILTGLLFWALSDVENLLLLDRVPHLVLWWSPIATMSALVFLTLTTRNNYGRALALGLGLLIGVTPIREEAVSASLQKWLRTGVIVVAGLVELVSLYALAAVVYRTAQGGLTLNRLAVIGWNSINIGILFWLLYRQYKDGSRQWIASLQSVFSLATNGYVVWGLFMLLVVPILF